MQGWVSSIAPGGRYGFVTLGSEGRRIGFFFHATNVIGDMPKVGEAVDFWLDDAPKGDLMAVEVRRFEEQGT